MSSERPCALTIAGSDSGGCAGIQTDLRTFAALRVHGCSALTAVTAQNTRGVSAVHLVPPDQVLAQVDSVLSDLKPAAAKTGMLASAEIIQALAGRLATEPGLALVVDPVMIASSGARLLPIEAVAALRHELLPLAKVVTPNIPEAEVLVGFRIRNRRDQEKAARALLDIGACAVLLKGGHGEDRNRVHDLYLDAQGPLWLVNRRLPLEGHGTGCTLAAALAALLAGGISPRKAAKAAVAFVHRALDAGYRPGFGPLWALDPLAAAEQEIPF